MKRNGFTLIELLAVIVILAIIALIATPIVLNIINNAKTSSNERSGELYVKAVENAIMKKQMSGTETVEDGEYKVQSDGSICIEENDVCKSGTTIIIDVEGDAPTEGTLTVSNGVVVSYNLDVSGTSVTKGDSSDDEEVTVAGATFSDGNTLTWDQLRAGVDEEIYGYDHEYIFEDKIIDSEIVSDVEFYGAFIGCSSLKSITLPSTVTEIGYAAFAYSSLTDITIPNSVESIGTYAFQNTSLTSVIIPSSVSNIEDGVFYECTSLANITIPSSVTSIGESSFLHCTSLTSITLPSSILNIKSEAFDSCTNLSSISYNEANYTSKSAFKSVFESYNENNTIGNNAFRATALSE